MFKELSKELYQLLQLYNAERGLNMHTTLQDLINFALAHKVVEIDKEDQV